MVAEEVLEEIQKDIVELITYINALIQKAIPDKDALNRYIKYQIIKEKYV
ncbi:hypothetical protein LCGC14_1698570 [marine sediment metagenome]|uniref:Uncharacterized protein n=1 Tax=marine sediment metagenome TaxID=412755 RepID=A0A0F9HJ79_9ZZZZ